MTSSPIALKPNRAWHPHRSRQAVLLRDRTQAGENPTPHFAADVPHPSMGETDYRRQCEQAKAAMIAA